MKISDRIVIAVFLAIIALVDWACLVASSRAERREKAVMKKWMKERTGHEY